MTTSEIIADNVKWVAKLNGKLMKDIEEHCGVSQGYFSRAKQGLSVEILDKLCLLLNLEPQDLMCKGWAHEEFVSREARSKIFSIVTEMHANSLKRDDIHYVIDSIYDELEEQK